MPFATNRAGQWISGVAIAAGLALIAPAAIAVQAPPHAQADALPPGPGHDLFAKTCSGCHATNLATSQRKSADDWTTIVIEMRSRGAAGSDEDMEAIINYLAANFGPGTPPARVNINSATASEIAGALSLPPEQGTLIAAFREKNGKFKNIAALESVPGADTAKIEAAKDRIDF